MANMATQVRLDKAGEPLRLMAVHAHPDDESSKGAATMAKYVSEGVEVMVVTCTGGERGDILNAAVDTPENAANTGGWAMSTRACRRATPCRRCPRAASPWPA